MKRGRIPLVISGLAAALAVGVPQAGPALAHERREVGNYQLTAGWAVEPPLVGEKNAITLRVVERVFTRPVAGLERTLRVEVSAGGQRRELELSPVFREPGSYNAGLIPTRGGDYAFRVSGTIEGLEMNLRPTAIAHRSGSRLRDQHRPFRRTRQSR